MFLIPLTWEESLKNIDNVKLPQLHRSSFVAPRFLTTFNNFDGFLPWLSRTSVGKRNLLTITSSGSDTELHESPLMLADSFSIFHPSPSSSSHASRGRNGTGVRSASCHDEEKPVRETLKWCDLNRTAERRDTRPPPPHPPPAPRAPEHRTDSVFTMERRCWSFIASKCQRDVNVLIET